MEKNREYQGEVLSLGSEGEGVINCDGVTVFTPFCLPGERVSFKALKVARQTAYGKLTEVHTVSPRRVQPKCPYFEKCGGCQLQHAEYSLQLEFKRQTVKSCLKKIGGLDVEPQPTVSGGSEYAYRNKLVMPVGKDANGDDAIGFYAPRSHRIIDMDDCVLHGDWAKKIISCLREFMLAEGLHGYDEATRGGDIRHIVGRQLQEKLIITVVATKILDLSAFEKLLEKQFKNFTLLLNVNTSCGNAVFGSVWKTLRGDGYFSGEDCGVKFKAGANTFLQVNDRVRALLYRAVLEECSDKNAVAVDLYSGGGMLTAMLAKSCRAAYGVEIVPQAVACADELKAINGLQDRMFNICGAVEDKIGEVFSRTAGYKRVVVCDPPRKGMERSVVKAVLSCGAERVVLVSCNPSTLARDLGLLCGSLKEVDGQIIKNPAYGQGGLSGYYEIEKVIPFDMFPQTKHVETLVTLFHKKPDSHIEVTVDFENGKIKKDGIIERAESKKPKEKH